MTGSKFIPRTIYNRTAAGRRQGLVMKGVHDEGLIRREWHNPNKFKVVLHMMLDKIPYIQSAGITPGWKIIEIEPQGFAIANHGYYKIVEPEMELIQLITNYGKSIGIGNKLPSKPIIEKGDNVDA
jgi:hypothetical protein